MRGSRDLACRVATVAYESYNAGYRGVPIDLRESTDDPSCKENQAHRDRRAPNPQVIRLFKSIKHHIRSRGQLPSSKLTWKLMQDLVQRILVV